MKKLSISLLMFLFTIPVFAQWEWQMPQPTGAALNDAGAFGPDAVFMIGSKGTIIKTPDNGNSFVQIESGTNRLLKSIYCINENTGWISSDSGLVLRTENSGTTWAKVREPRGWDHSSFFALDENTAWLSTGYDKLLKTTDGGQSWVNIETDIGKSFSLMKFLDAVTGFALINESTPEQTSYTDTVVLKTQDGGQHWDTLNLAFHNNVNFIETYGDNSVWLGTFDYMMKSDDRGQTWDTVWLPDKRYMSDPLSIAFRSTDSLWLLTFTSVGDFDLYNIYYTTDGGISWDNQYHVFNNIWGGSGGCTHRINRLTYTFGTCWAVGSPGTVLSHNDSDTSWQIHYKTARGSILDLFFTDKQNGYAVGNNYTLMKTQDGGKRWENAGDLPGKYGWRVYFTSKEQGFVSIVDEGLFKTTDGGKTWEKVLEKNGFLKSIVFNGTGEGWVLHSRGELYHTTDGGKTWQLLSTLPTPDYNYWLDLQFLNPLEGFAVGSRGIWKTFDGGVTWEEAFNPDQDINSIYFIDDQTGWAVGYDGFICKTTDGGKNWEVKDKLLNSPLWYVEFMNEQTGYLISDGYGIFRTSDGGETWAFEPVFNFPLQPVGSGWKALTIHGNEIWASYECQILHKTDETVGITPGRETSENGLVLYPNPVVQELFIESKNPITELTIINLNGQILINRKQLNNNRISQQVDFLSPGIYFLKATSEKGIVMNRFVKMGSK